MSCSYRVYHRKRTVYVLSADTLYVFWPVDRLGGGGGYVQDAYFKYVDATVLASSS